MCVCVCVLYICIYIYICIYMHIRTVGRADNDGMCGQLSLTCGHCRADRYPVILLYGRCTPHRSLRAPWLSNVSTSPLSRCELRSQITCRCDLNQNVLLLFWLFLFPDIYLSIHSNHVVHSSVSQAMCIV